MLTVGAHVLFGLRRTPGATQETEGSRLSGPVFWALTPGQPLPVCSQGLAESAGSTGRGVT